MNYHLFPIQSIHSSKKSDTSSNLPPTQSILIAVICLRFYLQCGSTNFHRNPVFAAEFTQIFEKLLHYAELQPNCLKVEQHSNIISLSFQIAAHREFSFTSALHDLQELTAPSNSSRNCLLRTAIAADFGRMQIVSDHLAHPLFSSYLWLGDIQERAQILVRAAGSPTYPNCLITHSAYLQLSCTEQKNFPKNYYYDHICCHGKIASRDIMQHCHYSESCGISHVI